jgi:protein phosphatase 1 regulatory subunit 12A
VSKNARLDICNNDSDLPIDLVDSSNVQMRDYLEEEMQAQNISSEFEKQKEELVMLEDAQKIDFKERVHTKTGATPLHVAAAKGYLRVIE